MMLPATLLRRPGASLLSLVLVAPLASGCTTFRPIFFRPIFPTQGGTYEAVRPGDELRVVTRDGREIELVVTTIGSDGFVGRAWVTNWKLDTVTVAFSDIARTERAGISAGKSTALGLGIVGMVVGFVAIVIATLFPDGPIESDGTAGRGTRHAVPYSPSR